MPRPSRAKLIARLRHPCRTCCTRSSGTTPPLLGRSLTKSRKLRPFLKVVDPLLTAARILALALPHDVPEPQAADAFGRPATRSRQGMAVAGQVPRRLRRGAGRGDAHVAGGARRPAGLGDLALRPWRLPTSYQQLRDQRGPSRKGRPALTSQPRVPGTSRWPRGTRRRSHEAVRAARAPRIWQALPQSGEQFVSRRVVQALATVVVHDVLGSRVVVQGVDRQVASVAGALKASPRGLGGQNQV
jgi:hypothetical protein